MQEFLPGLFHDIVSEAEFKQHGQTDPPYPGEKQLHLVQLGKLLPQHKKGPAEKARVRWSFGGLVLLLLVFIFSLSCPIGQIASSA